MEFRDLLRRRRMIRHYTGQPVDREVLEDIAATLRRAPSAGYSQGQRFLVVTDPELLARIAEPFEQEIPAGAESWFGTAAAHVIVLVREQDYHDRYRRPDKLQDGEEIDWPVPYWYVDAGAALMLVLLAAIDEGLAAGVYGVMPEEEARLRELLRIPSDLTVVAGITLGRAAPDPGWSETASRRTQPRRPVEDLVRWNRWS
jgi:nitroreductase